MASKKIYTTVAAILVVCLLTTHRRITNGENEMEHSKKSEEHTNRLINESSPYLLQHADNPVNWYPWSTEAFEAAENENKPIFLSIGYSTCHWCHVMAHESFENQQIAEIMNKNFISIKVDREQRPDVDSVYMSAVQMMTGSGGWPLSVFLTPKGKPFYGGTYFPPTDSFGRPGFDKVLLTIADAWKNSPNDIAASADKISAILSSQTTTSQKQNLTIETLQNAHSYLENSFDNVNAGFGVAPKFPQPTNLLLLLRYWNRTGDKNALRMAERTLDTMAKGGIYDHVGGGFHRYSTDPRWLVPHFEKMLYDQALLSKAYLQAYQITKNPEYAKTARHIFDYVLRDMTGANHGFYAAEDADSEGLEGKFYVWTPQQIRAILPERDADIFEYYYGVTKTGNFEHSATILSVTKSIQQLQKKFDKDPNFLIKNLETSLAKLLSEREKRIRPHLDDKIITAWNGLMISSMAYGSIVLRDEKYAKAAAQATDFILNDLKKKNRLMRYYRNGRATEPAFLNDYAFFILGLLDLYQATFDVKYLKEAKNLTEQMMELFTDDTDSLFLLAGKDAEQLIVKTRPAYDGAIPSGNSVAAFVLLKLGQITMDNRFTDRGNKLLQAASKQLNSSPAASTAMLLALDLRLGPAQEIVIAGDIRKDDTENMIELVRSKYLPNAVIILHPDGSDSSEIEKIVPFVKYQGTLYNKATAYLCQNYICQRPTNDINEFKKALAEIERKVKGKN